MSVPLGFLSSRNLPIGMQFCAGFNQEHLLLALAGQLESAYPWQTRKPACGLVAKDPFRSIA